MVSSFFRNAIFQVSLNLLVKGVYLFGVERMVQNLLPEGDYGLYFALLGLGMLLQVVADFGLQLYNSRELSGDREQLAQYFPYFIGLKIILGAAFFLVLLPVGWWLGYRGAEIYLLLIAGAVQFFNSVVLYLRSNLSGLGKYALDGWFSIMDKSLMILSVGGLLLFAPEELTITRFAGLQLASWGVTAVLLVVAIRDRLPRKLPRFDRATFGKLLRGGAPFALAVFLATAYTRTDAIMIERLLVDGAEAASHYAAAYRLLDALNMVGWLLAGLLIPMYARLQAEGKDEKPLLKFSVQLLLAGSVCAAVPLAFYSQPIVDLLYDFAESRTGLILLFLACSFVAQCLNYAYGSLLSARGFIGRMNKIYALGIVLNLGGNWLVLPIYGAPGAAAITLLTQSFIAVTQAVLAHRWLNIPAGTIAWWKTLLFATIFASCGLAFYHFAPLPWLPACLLLGVLGLGGASLSGLIDWRQLQDLGTSAGAARGADAGASKG
ncbi:oligosaccharide flippase family protein [Neolewinella agarilytica]|uniref:Membrane protein involved in the export of O-antigen and teichoic acid n=1 Tax=Neolewinella agarilytica TaxID=478744 RepID=A0A1H9ILN9_9BACT|nr:oligosaccharide flippase family protein [Neolewinella agarilytica]SEQ75478.1 Membrane protein involved in the export of O-antigen and teichoic acid [Neolewinella agarilytica]